MRYMYIASKVILSLILVTPILGEIGIFPAPTRDLYNSDVAYNFIHLIMTDVWYVSAINAIVCALVLLLLWTKREALAALLLLPLTTHVIAFHLFLDGGLVTAGAIMANIMLVINLYLVYNSREKYRALIK